jgi:uncharacterized membrane protein YesL
MAFKIDPTSRTVDGVNTLLTFIALNCIYLVCCLPIVTIGIATTALFEVTIRFADEERGYLIKDYFASWGKEWWRASLVYACFGVPLAALGFAGTFWIGQGVVATDVMGLLALLGCCYVFAAMLYGFALVARYRNTMARTIANAWALPLVEPARTMMLLIVPAFAGLLVVLVPVLRVPVMLIGFALCAYVSGIILLGTFARHSQD